MAKIIETCHKCKSEVPYNQSEDEANNDLIPKRIKKVIVDETGNSFGFYAIPKDKQRLIDKKFIKFECSKCHVPVE